MNSFSICIFMLDWSGDEGTVVVLAKSTGLRRFLHSCRCW